MRLSGKTYYLLLHRPSLSDKPRIFAFNRRDRLTARWRSGDRTSPIFPSTSATLPSFDDSASRWIVFCGPLYPELTRGFKQTFVSLGLFNQITVVETAAELSRLDELLTQHKVPWERWKIRSNIVENVDYSIQLAPKLKRITQLRPQSPSLEIREAAYEYVKIINSLIGHSSSFDKALADDLVRFDSGCRKLLSLERIANENVAVHGLLTTVNTVLVRLYSQTFSGVTPILEREMYYQSHSLLGVGTASLAIVKLRRFIEDAFHDRPIVKRLRLLRAEQPLARPVFQLPPKDSFWRKDHLYSVEQLEEGHESSGLDSSDDDPAIPLVSCISSRDGFKSTEVSLSVPREIVVGCNSAAWSILTATHEISHCLIADVLGELMPSPADNEAIARAILLLKGNTTTLHEQLTEWLCFGFARLDAESSNFNLPTKPSALKKIIRNKWRFANEIMTHVFDFLYFYRKNAARYMDSIWASWAAIPNIDHRIEEYVVRSLSALYALNMERPGSERYAETSRQLIQNLKTIESRFPDAQYISDAVAELEARETFYATEIRRIHQLVKFVKYVLYSEAVATRLNQEPLASSGKREGYSLSPMLFDEGRIQNPIRFLEVFSKDKRLNGPRSCWILQQMAFSRP